MTTPRPPTKAAMNRAVQVARTAGACAVEVRPDGTIVIRLDGVKTDLSPLTADRPIEIKPMVLL